MNRYEYCAELREGYKPTMESYTQNVVYFTVEAKNRVTADRMVATLLRGAENVTEICGVCID